MSKCVVRKFSGGIIMSITTISVIGGFIVSALTIVGSVWGNYYTKKKEIEKEITLKVFENSFKEYEFRTKELIKEAEKSGKSATIYPYDYYLIHFSQLIKLMEKNKLTEENIKKVVHDQKLFRQVYQRELEKSDD
jgi:hypothetical protein